MSIYDSFSIELYLLNMDKPNTIESQLFKFTHLFNFERHHSDKSNFHYSMSILERHCGVSTPVWNDLKELWYDFYRIWFSDHTSPKNAIQALRLGKVVSVLNFIFLTVGITQLNLCSVLWCWISAKCPLSLHLSSQMLAHQSECSPDEPGLSLSSVIH